MFNYKDKQKNLRVLNNYMLAKTLSMFEWENLPITIPYKELEKLLQVNGFAFITKFKNELYAFNGALGGEQDAYGNPTKFIISNPHLKFNETLDIEKDGVLIYNDDLAMGLIPLLDRYNTFLVENDINMMMYGYNSRTQKLISASDDKTKASAQLAVKKAIDGDIEVIGESIIFDGVKVHSGSTNNGLSITNLTEFHQYIKGTLFNELGLSANFNMKRERLTAGEAEMGDDSNYPFIYNMLKCRLKAIEKINEMFGTDINIQFGSVWAKTSNEVIDDKINPSAKIDPITGEEIKPEQDPEQDPKADPEQDPEQDPKADPEQDPEQDPKADPEQDPEQDPKADPEQDPKADPEQDPEQDPKADPEQDPELESKIEALEKIINDDNSTDEEIEQAKTELAKLKGE